MDTITEAAHQEAEEEEAAKQNQEATTAQNQREAMQKQGQGDQGQGDDTKQNQGKAEKEERGDIAKEQPSQGGDQPSSELQSNDVISPEDGSSNNNMVQRHPQQSVPHDTETTELRSGRESPVKIEMSSDSPGWQQEEVDNQPGTPRDKVENSAIKTTEEKLPGKTVKTDKVPPSRDSNSEAGSSNSSSGDEHSGGSATENKPTDEEPVGSKGVVECYNRAFTTDDDDDLPIEV